MNFSGRKKQQNVTIKGTKDGITLHLDDCCSFSELLMELDEKLSTHYYDGDGRSLIEVHVKVGNRYLTEVQQEEIRTLIRNKKNLVVDSIESDVITKANNSLERNRNCPYFQNCSLWTSFTCKRKFVVNWRC